MVEEIRDILEWVGGRLGGDHQVWGVVLAAASLALAADFFLGFPATREFGLRFLKPGRLPCGCHFRLPSRRVEEGV